MVPKPNLCKITLIVLGAFMLSSCGVLVKAQAKKYATVEKGAIPMDFGKEQTTLLFVTSSRSYNKYLKKNIKKAYHGNYELVVLEDLHNKKYNDLSKYRYIFDYNYVTYTYHNDNEVIYGPGGGIATGKVKRFAITDRKEDKMYIMPMTSGFWSKLQRVYLKNLDEQRIKNQ